MGNKVFVVTDGEYSSYRIRCACSTMEKAEEARIFYNSGRDIDIYELDALPETPNGYLRWIVTMDHEGNSTVKREDSSEKIYHDWQPYGQYFPQGSVIFEMYARDETHAVKIANEKRIALLDSGEWTTDWDKFIERNLRRGNSE